MSSIHQFYVKTAHIGVSEKPHPTPFTTAYLDLIMGMKNDVDRVSSKMTGDQYRSARMFVGSLRRHIRIMRRLFGHSDETIEGLKKILEYLDGEREFYDKIHGKKMNKDEKDMYAMSAKLALGIRQVVVKYNPHVDKPRLIRRFMDDLDLIKEGMEQKIREYGPKGCSIM